MFNLNSKYTKIYFDIINKYKDVDGYDGYEKHHIIPRSCGGGDEDENIANVPLRVHYILHRILPKILQNDYHISKMYYALWLMSTNSKNTLYISSRLYEILKLNIKNNHPFKGKKRPEQSEVLRKANLIRWEKEERIYTCAFCSTEKVIVETKMKKYKVHYCCNRSCYAFYKNPNGKLAKKYLNTINSPGFDMNKCLAKEKIKKVPWNKGLRKENNQILFDMSKKLSNSVKGRAAWNKGIPCNTGRENGINGAKKQRETVTGRRKYFLENENRNIWIYPDKDTNQWFYREVIDRNTFNKIYIEDSKKDHIL